MSDAFLHAWVQDRDLDARELSVARRICSDDRLTSEARQIVRECALLSDELCCDVELGRLVVDWTDQELMLQLLELMRRLWQRLAHLQPSETEAGVVDAGWRRTRANVCAVLSRRKRSHIRPDASLPPLRRYAVPEDPDAERDVPIYSFQRPRNCGYDRPL